MGNPHQKDFLNAYQRTSAFLICINHMFAAIDLRVGTVKKISQKQQNRFSFGEGFCQPNCVTETLSIMLIYICNMLLQLSDTILILLLFFRQFLPLFI